MKSFLLSEVKSKQGKILHTDGRILGSHDGAAYYTVGQRHGLDIKDGAGPYFVISKDMKRNTITVGSQADLMRTAVSITHLHWIAGRPKANKRLVAKIRYRTPSIPVRISGSRVTFARPVQAVAPGQSIVFYEGATVVGGALLS
jgi:tRNA-specific 2-thiouridylase